MQSRQRKRHASWSLSRSSTCRYIFWMLVCTAILYCSLKRSRITRQRSGMLRDVEEALCFTELPNLDDHLLRRSIS
ncbi:hypothetical protein T07_5265 [Trichinella nelsoni]|uniref:Uncharacterized protein n=1 Tax=Trichinella nelsoni TaxID=6336 RepID=A0A0V0RH09_9BILA|nr:hypothetical protein T07_5265 [Trichinella nelsoni]